MADINQAYQWAISTCNEQNVGYSQTYRNQETVNGITYYDCSSFVNYALNAGGFSTPNYAPNHNAFTTGTMANVLLSLGFKEVNSKGNYVAGDIGLSSGHTEMCYKGGSGKGVFMGAHTSNAPLEYQVSIGSSGGNVNYERSFPRIFRYAGGASGTASSIYVVSALAGNAWRESHINPTLAQQGGTAFGLFQWDGGRKTSLLNWLAMNGYSSADPNGQMQYLVVENDWQGSLYGIASLNDFLTSTSTNIAELTEAFCTCWERAGKPELQERIDFANKAYQYLLEHAYDSVSWITEPMYYLSESQALNNAILLYQFYSGGVIPTPTGGKRRRSVWKMIRRPIIFY